MANGLVLYRSKYGSTKKYATWLSEELGFACVDVADVRGTQVEEAEAVVLCGGVYASGIAGIKQLRKYRKALTGKPLAVLCVGASPYQESALQAVRERNLGKEFADVPLYYARGAWNEAVMSGKDKLLCTMLKKYVSKKDPADYAPWEAALVEAMGTTCDWTDRQYLAPLIGYMREHLPT